MSIAVGWKIPAYPYWRVMKTRAESLLEALESVPGSISLNEGIFGRPEQQEIDRLSSEIRVQLKEAIKKDRDKFMDIVVENRLLPQGYSTLETLGSDNLIDSFVEKSLRMSSLVHVRDFHDKCRYLFNKM